MSDLRGYQEVILDHNRNPRNFGPLDDANRHAEGYNPLCGDKVTVHLKVDGDRVEAIRFEGSGCAISTASASVMTQIIKGKSATDASALFDGFHSLVTGGEVDEGTLGKLAVFGGVAAYPARVKCAILCWHTMKAALDGADEPISTE